MTQLPNIKDLETEIRVDSKNSMIQRVISRTYLSDSYIDNLFQMVSRKLKELKTLDEILEIVERLCIEIYEQEMTFDAYNFLQTELKKLILSNRST